MQYQSECLSALKSVANEILMYGGNFVIKGDGADKTFLEMETPNLPKKKSDMYSSPVMINIKHNLWLGAEYEVTGNAEKGAFKVKVAGASNFKVGEWVCLYLHDNNPELVRRELLPYTWESTMTNISTEGVQVEDYHQIVSEAASIISSANFSAYKINITKNRGHSAIRSQGSSRVFIGAVRDCTDGPLADQYPTFQANAGQYHACGVSKPSMGAVIWRVTWGDDACFESHATQPRATLIDNCTGGFVQSKQGGDANQVPNHLNDLTIWNMCATKTAVNGGGTLPGNGELDWWRMGWKYWKILPPVVVGFHGASVKFVKEQVKLDESNGIPVEPQSLYEAQLKHRLGTVPAWLNALKQF